MKMVTIQNPFSPGPGSIPAHIVGRPNEQKTIVEVLQSILADRDENGRLPQTLSPQVIVGPRGVGKTTLLNLSIQWASDAGIHIVDLDKALLTGDEKNLKKAITPSGRLEKFKKYLKHFKGSLRVEDVFNFEVGPTGDLDPTDLKATMAAGTLAGPMAIFLDEAHTVPAESMQLFCNAAQKLMSRGYPLALVMAGTPGLREALRGIEATFMERSEFISLNLLTKEQAREALSVPAADTGMPMEDDALEMLVEWSDCYPFFIQQAGRFSWEIAKGRGSGRITLDDAKQALTDAGKLRRDFYYYRLKELVKLNIDPYAMQTIELFEKQPGCDMSYLTLIDGIQKASVGMARERAVEIADMLISIGFIYENHERCEAGIPSLFNYVKERVQAG